MNSSAKPVYYGNYLRLDRLLSAQVRESEHHGRPAHDEMLFIIIHQTYELWFKQILFELEAVQAEMAQEFVPDSTIGRVTRALDRVHAILKLLIRQVDILETMTPLDFLDFRDLLSPASGFESLQFRLIEAQLGLERVQRLAFDSKSFDARLSPEHRQVLEAAEARPSLARLVENWLERTPFIDFGDWTFQETYRAAVIRHLEADKATIRMDPTLTEARRAADLERLEGAERRFAALFDLETYSMMQAEGRWRFSLKALQAALLIMLYRDEPALALPHQLLKLLMDIDEAMTTWRYRHAQMVHRMIGVKVGTGGSSGAGYLRRTADHHTIFADLFALSTFLIARSTLPDLPSDLRRAMAFRYAEGRS